MDNTKRIKKFIEIGEKKGYDRKQLIEFLKKKGIATANINKKINKKRKNIIMSFLIFLIIIYLITININNKYYNNNKENTKLLHEITQKLNNISNKKTNINLVKPLLINYIQLKKSNVSYNTSICSKKLNVSESLLNNLKLTYEQKDGNSTLQYFTKALNVSRNKTNIYQKVIKITKINHKIKECKLIERRFNNNKTFLLNIFEKAKQNLFLKNLSLIKQFKCKNKYEADLFEDGNKTIIIKFSFFNGNDPIHNLKTHNISQEFRGKIIYVRYFIKEIIFTKYPINAFYSANEYAIDHLC